MPVDASNLCSDPAYNFTFNRDDFLKPSTNRIIAIIAVITLAGFAYNSFIHQRTLLAPKITAAACTPEAIREVVDALERSVLSAQCAKQAQTGTDQPTKPTH